MFGQTEHHTNMRIACTPKGPTLSFRVVNFSLGKDVRNLQKRPIDYSAAMKTSPLVVMNNFNKDLPHQRVSVCLYDQVYTPSHPSIL
jgi:ribosome biogenesis protein SSF1/2